VLVYREERDALATVTYGQPMSAWVDQVFRAGQANAGGVVRRSISDVERLVGLDEFVEECRRRHFHVIETGDQLVVLCHEGSMVIHC
jgi:hypothetical protein